MNHHEPITSPANPRVREAARLRDAEDRRRTGCTLVDGLREIERAIRAEVEIPEAFLDAEAPADALREGIMMRLAARGTRIVALARRPFEKVAFGSRNEGLVAVARFHARDLDAFAVADDRPVIVIEGVEKPGNLGAIVRTADAAGIAGVIACGPGTDPANPAAIRASLGTVFCVPLAVGTVAEVIAWCGRQARRVLGAVPEGALVWHEAPLAGATAIVLGSEAHGLSPAWREAGRAGTIRFDTVRLPMQGVADSLNVSVTAAVLAYESLRTSQDRRSR
ncbi:MAG: RNA methyltransferase [Planctomycetia bacterium]|nr:RNA methyltransferase [Planctomycetia bacterium]